MVTKLLMIDQCLFKQSSVNPYLVLNQGLYALKVVKVLLT